MMVLEIPNPIRGAAFRVLYEAAQPVFCHTRERQAEIQAYLDSVILWARATQSEEVATAYAGAAGDISREIEKQMKTLELGQQVQASYDSIPHPPFEPPKQSGE